MSFTLNDILLAVLVWVAALLYLRQRMKPDGRRISERLQQVVNDAVEIKPDRVDTDDAEQPALTQFLMQLGNKLPLFSAQQQRNMAKMLVRGGWRSPMAVPVLIGSKLACGGCLALLSLLSTLPEKYNSMTAHSLLFLGMFMLGMILPELYAQNVGTHRQEKIEHALPDALDLMVICTNAGYSLGNSLLRASRELEKICPPLADEFSVTQGELQLSGDVGEALRHLGERVGSLSLRSLVVTLLQSQQYGTPISQALRQLAKSERTARMMRLEERAAKLSTKITIPMVLMILPAVVLIAAGPAIMNLMAMTGHQ
ncbi:type II secretion system F family protein [Paludibacterium purpuratum]|uniref:Type II secretion system protein F (GspF) n=1 Tax=Paludibacterium purpuratum TaxID=1144873 RepID=A0A4R7B8N0_9NEIS|nr:type II secretion system F family protein [Paludibacterium purpuratum]TDR80242.1 type II secretion system protein F (GspF) [Paludibacterium purpuratum]